MDNWLIPLIETFIEKAEGMPDDEGEKWIVAQFNSIAVTEQMVDEVDKHFKGHEIGGRDITDEELSALIIGILIGLQDQEYRPRCPKCEGSLNTTEDYICTKCRNGTGV
jgi:hypothetical protein